MTENRSDHPPQPPKALENGPETLTGIVLGALLSPHHPDCAEILQMVGSWLEEIADTHGNKGLTD